MSSVYNVTPSPCHVTFHVGSQEFVHGHLVVGHEWVCVCVWGGLLSGVAVKSDEKAPGQLTCGSTERKTHCHSNSTLPKRIPSEKDVDWGGKYV